MKIGVNKRQGQLHFINTKRASYVQSTTLNKHNCISRDSLKFGFKNKAQ